MKELALTDKSVKPDDSLIHSAIGDNMKYWTEFMEYMQNTYSDLTLDWKAYKDAKCWLMPVSVKKKNLCWITILIGAFRVSFWFGKKLENQVLNSDLPDRILEEYRNAEQNKMGRGISITVENQVDLEHIKRLLEFKAAIK